MPCSRVVTNQLTTTREQQTTHIHSVKTESLHATTYPMAAGRRLTCWAETICRVTRAAVRSRRRRQICQRSELAIQHQPHAHTHARQTFN